MLRQRVITALVLLAVLLPALFATVAWPFAAIALVAVAAAGWEWARLNGLPGAGAVAYGAVLAGLCVATWAAGASTATPPTLWWMALLAWVIGGALVLPRALRAATGLLLLWLTWLALSNARQAGVAFLLSVLCIVWAADIAAYFGGRAFGRRKLAPAISPGKSWAGAWSGLAGALLLALAWWASDRALALPADGASWFTQVAGRIGVAGMLLATAFLAAMSIVGDLFESLVKRSAGAKDSSRLLPGHGGVLDRIDALLPVLPLALALASL
ncbi:phosphatidate cytidylyltransferase [Piscinibacter sakaiensis]|uniref:phosphatidate cytidylyltransferase n=1 Tax=Piscinibacter sakaiensis TaxID=1547922 RepID=UPI003726901E